MAGWGEAVADIVFGSLFIFLLVRLATSTDSHLKTPFYKLFITTGMYSLITVASYQIVGQFKYSEKYWTVYIFKAAFGINSFGAKAATIGQFFIATHRYFVIRARDFSEKNWTTSRMRRLLVAQFIICLILSAPVWPASYVYKNGVIIALDPVNTLILKSSAVTSYFLFVLCNGVLTILTSREMLKLRRILKNDITTSHTILIQQRHMFIIVAVCSVTYLIKALQQLTIAVATQFQLGELYAIIWPLASIFNDGRFTSEFQYPVVNGLATYVPPVCLVFFSKKVRDRVTFRTRIHHSTEPTTRT